MLLTNASTRNARATSWVRLEIPVGRAPPHAVLDRRSSRLPATPNGFVGALQSRRHSGLAGFLPLETCFTHDCPQPPTRRGGFTSIPPPAGDITGSRMATLAPPAVLYS